MAKHERSKFLCFFELRYHAIFTEIFHAAEILELIRL